MNVGVGTRREGAVHTRVYYLHHRFLLSEPFSFISIYTLRHSLLFPCLESAVAPRLNFQVNGVPRLHHDEHPGLEFPPRNALKPTARPGEASFSHSTREHCILIQVSLPRVLKAYNTPNRLVLLLARGSYRCFDFSLQRGKMGLLCTYYGIPDVMV